jgi:hypothetical protein
MLAIAAESERHRLVLPGNRSWFGPNRQRREGSDVVCSKV